MKKSTKIASAVVITVGVITAGGAYAAKSMDRDHSQKADYAVGFIADKLELDTTQEQALSALKDQVLAARSVMHEQMGTARDDVKSLVEADSFDQAKALEMVSTKTASIVGPGVALRSS